MEFVARKDDWIKYADSVRDNNPIHRDDALARGAGLEGAIAPGMWLASHVQGNSKIKKAEFSFKKPVYDGETIKRNSYSFRRGDEVVCKGDVIFGEPTNQIVFLPEDIVKIAYFQDFLASEKDVMNYLNSLGFDGERANPEMYLMSLSAPTLLGYAELNGLVGIHAYQSMEVCRPFDLGNVTVNVEEEKIGKRMCKFNLYWESRGEVVATGKSKVLPVSI